jgi:hypothetical protein
MSACGKTILRRKTRKFWIIANLLIRNSVAFRTAVMNKILGKAGR